MTHGCWFCPTERELLLMFSDISTQISHTFQCQEYHVTDLLIIGFFNSYIYFLQCIYYS